jgi:hypothetical protein
MRRWLDAPATRCSVGVAWQTAGPTLSLRMVRTEIVVM